MCSRNHSSRKNGDESSKGTFANLSAVNAEVAARPPAAIVTDELIEEILSQTAERLVQDEIERIKMGS